MGNRISIMMKVVSGAALFLATMAANAQFNASLSGTVQDTTQAVIGGAVVTLTNDATQATQTATSSSGGTYQFNELPPGSYTLVVTAKTFQKNSISNVTVTAETPRTLDVTMLAGQESQTVTVNACLLYTSRCV